MKKVWITLITISLILFTGSASAKNTDSPELDVEALLKDMSGTYVCSVDYGYGQDYTDKHKTYLCLSADGSFLGYYFIPSEDESKDSKKTVISSNFNGRFQNMMSVGENRYYTDTSKLDYQSPPASEGNMTKRKYLSTVSFHIVSFSRFDIYAPETKCSELPNAAKKWLAYNDKLPENEEDPVGMYILYNQESGDTFFQAIKKELIPPEKINASIDNDEYLGEDIMSMRIADILDLMGREITVEAAGDYTYVDQMKDICFYNSKKLPGFTFFIQPSDPSSTGYTEADIAGIKADILAEKYDYPKCVVMMDGARLNNEIGTDMTYCQILFVRKNFNVGSPTAQNHYVTQEEMYSNDKYDLIHAVIEYEKPENATEESVDEGQIDTLSLIKTDPKVRYISAIVKNRISPENDGMRK